MKQKLVKVYNELRNWMHVIGFLTLAYKMIGLTKLDLWTWQKIVLGLFLSALGYGIGHGYEGLRKILFGDPTSTADGNKSWIGFSIGVCLVMLIPGIKFINVYLFWFCLVLFVLDNGYAVYKKRLKA